MATSIPGWVPKFINQVINYREVQKVTAARLNELFNLLIVQGDWNTETFRTLLDNLTTFDAVYIEDQEELNAAFTALNQSFELFKTNINTTFADSIHELDTQQRLLILAQVEQFEGALDEKETAIELLLVNKLAEIQVLSDGITVMANDMAIQVTNLSSTVETLREDILADNQVIADAIAADKATIENLLEEAGDVVGGATAILEAVSAASSFPTAEGTATAITLENATLVNRHSTSFVASANNAGAVTTVNSKPLYKENTVLAPNLVAGKSYTIWYDTAGDCFFYKASAEGNVTADHVLAPDTFSNGDDIGVVGTMVDNSAVADKTLVSHDEEYIIPKGFHSGLHKVKAVITGLIASVIKAGTTVGGILGTFTSDATAIDANVISGKSYYRNGIKGTGSMPNKTGSNQAATNVSHDGLGSVRLVAPTGFYDGVSYVYANDPDFVSANFLSTKNMFGLQGSMPNRALAHTESTYVDSTLWSGRLYMRVPTGYYDSNYMAYYIDPNFIPSKIPSDVNLFGLQGSRSLGKKSASGTATSSSVQENWSSVGGTTYNQFPLSVTGLSFKPSVIIASTATSGQGSMSVYLAASDGQNTSTIKTFYFDNDSLSTSTLNIDGVDAYITSTSFIIVVQSGNKLYNWYAFE